MLRRGILLAAMLVPGAAFADEGDIKKAEQLYNDALALTDAGNFAAACPKYAESQRLDPALGTQFNLADCWEHTNQLAGAHALFTSVERAARAAGKTNLATRAHDRAVALDGRIPRLAITAPAAAELVVRVDGAVVPAESLGALPVDPGKHVVEARAAGGKSFRRSVDVAGGTTPLAIVFTEAEPAKSAAPIERKPSKSFRIAGATVAGFGAVGLVLGTVAGVSALSKRDEARDVCGNDEPSQCHAQAGVPLWDDAANAGTISTVAFAAGGALVVAGALLWIFAPSRTVTPTVGRFGLGGTF